MALRLLSFLLVLAFVTPAFGAIGPEQRLPAAFADVMDVSFDGTHFLIAYQAYLISPGLYVQRISTNGSLAGEPIEITTNAVRHAKLVGHPGSTALLWNEQCPEGVPGPCRLLGTWLRHGQPSAGEPSLLRDGISYFAAAPSPRGDGTVFVAWLDWWQRKDVQLSRLPQHATTFAGTEKVASEPYAGFWSLDLGSNGKEMLLVWRQTHLAAMPMPEPSLEARLKVQTLDADGRPIRAPLRLPYEYLADLTADGDDGFLLGVVGAARYPYVRHGRVVMQEGQIVTEAPTTDLFLPNIRRTPTDDPFDSYLTISRGDTDATYTLTSDPSYESGFGVARGGDYVLVAYSSRPREEDGDHGRPRVSFRVVDKETFAALPPAPSAPRVKAVLGSSSAVAHLEWDAVPGARAYRIVQSIVDEPGVTIEHVFASDRLQASIELDQPETPYALALIVESEAGLSPPSHSVFATTPAAGAPRAPLNVAVDVRPGGRITLRWTDTSSNETGFHVIVGWGMFTLASAPPNATEVSFQTSFGGVLPFHVVSFNAAGESYSDTVVGEITPSLPVRRRSAGR